MWEALLEIWFNLDEVKEHVLDNDNSRAVDRSPFFLLSFGSGKCKILP